MNGSLHIDETFSRLRQQGRKALMPYVTLGYPDYERSLSVVEALAACGADLIELGVPFSDPLADGPTIQRSTQAALAAGMTVRSCLDAVQTLRQRGVAVPLLLMGYINPALAYGLERYIIDARAAGADGLIMPDLPMEESGDAESLCRENGLALVLLASPASSSERLERLSAATSGFLYLVSVAGVTGARDQLPPQLAGFVERARATARTPLAVGFGIATPEQARAVAEMADGVIIGSALINAMDRGGDPVEAAAEYVRSIRAALDGKEVRAE